jgi:predicted AAA+ superfamily ATPase
MEEPETHEREINSLVECLKFTRLKKGIILTLSREEHLEVDGVHIQCIPLYQWLLDGQKDSLE